MVFFPTMPRPEYHPLPRDEEQSHDTTREKKAEWLHPEIDLETLENDGLRSSGHALQKHWVWLAHAVLLSASVTFFALSLCMKGTTSVSDPSILSQITTYCMTPPRTRRRDA